MSLTIGSNKVVTIHYRLSNDEGNILDNSEASGPLKYLHGAGNIISGLENALEGKKAGDSLNIRLEPKDAYGNPDPEFVQTVNKSVFQGADIIEEGMMFEAEGSDGAVRRVKIVKVDGEDVTIDANHPLAGIALTFDVNVVEVREPEPGELDQE